MIRCRIDHSAADPPTALVLEQPVGQLQATSLADVPAVLTDAELAARRGHYVAGFVAYDAALAFDRAFRIPAAESPDGAPSLPLAWFGLFDRATPAPPLPRAEDLANGAGSSGWTCTGDPTTHAAAVDAIRRSIAEGDVYLVNHTTRFRRAWQDGDDPFALYGRLVAGYGVGYHAFLETEEWAVACGSPELFFESSAGQLVTRPIKGTAPRGRWSHEDADGAARLQTSEKERAENVMVVDLLRNDLGRVAVPGTVAVPSLAQLEQHPAMWQLTSTVTATATPDVGLAEVFAALFPCASVTGAPKVSAMSAIADLEDQRRGVYCGAVGLIAPPQPAGAHGPLARFAVAIRTAAVDKTRRVAEYGSGGGISWDSAPAAEWAEVLLKAGALAGSSAPALGAGHGLIETMASVPDQPVSTVRNLDRHLARLASSTRYFGLTVPLGIEKLVADAVAGLAGPHRVRLVLRSEGDVEIEAAPLDPNPDDPLWLCVDPDPVRSTDLWVFHKTTDRCRYDERMRRHPGADDVILVNERGELTETTRANLAVRIDGQWCTPPLDCGLLPGVERDRSLAEGRLVERVVTAHDLGRVDGIATLSSLRGWRAARIHPRCTCPDR